MSEEMKPIPLTLIVAATRSNAIGRGSTLPWRLSNEMAYFARMTKGENDGMNAVIMGRKSWEGIPQKFRPLKDRVNVVVTRQDQYALGDAPDSYVATSLDDAVNLLRTLPSSPSTSSSEPEKTVDESATTPRRIDRTFLIGGAQLYNLALDPPPPSSATTTLASPTTETTETTALPYTIERVLVTRILTDYPDCDTFLHAFDQRQDEWVRSSHEDLVNWAGWEVPKGVQKEKDRLVKEEEKIVEYEYQMWVKK